MDVEVDHYVILGLPTGQEGAKLSEKEIKKAYLSKALELHPDKRLDDPNAHENFQKLKTSYEILKDEKARKIFDDLLRVKHEKLMRQSQQNSKRRKMMSDLEERERAAFASDPSMKTHDEEERIARKLKEEIARIRAMHSSKATPVASTFKKGVAPGARESTSGGQGGLDKEKVLKVSWDRIGEGYSAQRLRELFQQFGEVEDVVIRSSTKKKGSALVVMASKDAIVTATRCVLGDLQNPLLVLPLQPAVAPTFRRAEEPVRSETPELSNLVGAGFQAFEDSVLSKLRKTQSRRRGFRAYVSSVCLGNYAGTSLVMTVTCSISNDHGHIARVGAWCWTETGRTTKVVHFVTFYAPLWGAIIFNGITYFQVIRMLNNAARMAVGMSDRAFNTDSRTDMKALNRWGYYPLILIGLWFFGTINHIYDFIEPGHKIFWLSVLDVGMAALMGLFNSIAYGLNPSVRRAIDERLDLLPESVKRWLPKIVKIRGQPEESELLSLKIQDQQE